MIRKLFTHLSSLVPRRNRMTGSDSITEQDAHTSEELDKILADLQRNNDVLLEHSLRANLRLQQLQQNAGTSTTRPPSSLIVSKGPPISYAEPHASDSRVRQHMDEVLISQLQEEVASDTVAVETACAKLLATTQQVEQILVMRKKTLG